MTMVTLIKRKNLIEAGLQFQRVSLLSSWQDGWWNAGKHDAGQVTEISISR